MAWSAPRLAYARTVPGVLSLAQLVLGATCAGCVCPPYLGAAYFFLTVAVLCFVVTLGWSAAHLFSLAPSAPPPPPPPLSFRPPPELASKAAATLLYFVGFLVLLVETAKERYVVGGGIPYPPYHHQPYNYDAYLAAGSLAVFNFFAYAAESLYHARLWIDARTLSVI